MLDRYLCHTFENFTLSLFSLNVWSFTGRVLHQMIILLIDKSLILLIRNQTIDSDLQILQVLFKTIVRLKMLVTCSILIPSDGSIVL